MSWHLLSMSALVIVSAFLGYRMGYGLGRAGERVDRLIRLDPWDRWDLGLWPDPDDVHADPAPTDPTGKDNT